MGRAAGVVVAVGIVAVASAPKENMPKGFWFGEGIGSLVSVVCTPPLLSSPLMGSADFRRLTRERY